MKKKGFTLVELLAVLALVGFLATLRYQYSKHKKPGINAFGANMVEYAKYPPVVERNLSLLKKWLVPPPPGQISGNRGLAGTKEVREAALRDIASSFGLKAEALQLLAYSGDGSAVVAGGLVVFSGWNVLGILTNTGTWTQLPQPRSEIKESKYFNRLGHAAVWRRAQDEKIVTVFIDTAGEARTTGVTETFHFLVDGSEWPSQLKRYRDMSRIDGFRGQVTDPQGKILPYEGKIPRDFLDSGYMPPAKLNGTLNGEALIPLLCYFGG